MQTKSRNINPKNKVESNLHITSTLTQKLLTVLFIKPNIVKCGLKETIKKVNKARYQ